MTPPGQLAQLFVSSHNYNRRLYLLPSSIASRLYRSGREFGFVYTSIAGGFASIASSSSSSSPSPSSSSSSAASRVIQLSGRKARPALVFKHTKFEIRAPARVWRRCQTANKGRALIANHWHVTRNNYKLRLDLLDYVVVVVVSRRDAIENQMGEALRKTNISRTCDDHGIMAAAATAGDATSNWPRIKCH